jgi:methionyl aminopeptidase
VAVAHQEIELKDESQLAAMRRAGLVVATTLAELADAARPGVSTGHLDELAERTIRAHGGIPSFKGYQGFPASICSSVNERVVHGIPRRDEILVEGDLVSLDCGAIVDGWHGDSAITVGIGVVEPASQELSQVCEDAMWAGLAAARAGARLTDISFAVQQAVRAGRPGRLSAGRSRRYGIVKHYGGHGIGSTMHQDPHILNYGRPGRGLRLVPGMALAIEPMVTLGAADTAELSDGWTVITRDGSRAAHWEHTVAITEDGPWVLTAFDGGRERLGTAASARAAAG